MMNPEEKKKWINFIKDIHLSKDWSFRPELLQLSPAELNDLSMEYLIYLMDEKISYDNDEYREMVLSLKKQYPTDSTVDMSNHEDYIIVLRREEIRRMYLSKDWTFQKPYLLHNTSVQRLNDLFADVLLKMKEEGILVDEEEYSKMTTSIQDHLFL